MLVQRESHLTPMEKETGRLESFSDGVFAVAITLLMLNLVVPDIHVVSSIPMSRGRGWIG